MEFIFECSHRMLLNRMLLNVTEWLASPGGTKFSKPTEEMSQEELNVFRKSFCTSAGNRDGTLSVLQKFINEIHLRAAIDRFLRTLPLNKPFSTISDLAFTEAKKSIRAFAKVLRKTGNTASLIEPIRNGQKPISNEQTRRNCSTAVSSDGKRAKLKSHKTTEDDLILPQSLFWSTRTRDSTPADANNSVLAKNPSRSWVFWWARSVGSNLYQPRKTIRVSEILKMNPMLRYFLSLTAKLASNHLHISSSNWCEGSHSKGMLIEFLSRIILTELLSHGNQSFLQYFYNVICQCSIKTLLDDSNLNAFQTFRPRLNILRLVDVP